MASRQDQGLQQINVGEAMLDLSRNAADNGLFVPSELTLLGKTLLQLDEVGKILDPAFDPNASIRRNVGEMMSQRMRKQATQGSLFGSLLEMKDFVGGLPSRLNRIMDVIANQELEVKVKSMDAKMMVEGIQKIANRITSGILLAALIMGASLLMRIQTSFRIFDYPGLAILCFLAAAAGGFWLVVSIFIQDQKGGKK
jgi:predicted unusual protein kinase regulating ubiquinone biosynthesis (AarF/ABC1/UbiB family)